MVLHAGFAAVQDDLVVGVSSRARSLTFCYCWRRNTVLTPFALQAVVRSRPLHRAFQLRTVLHFGFAGVQDDIVVSALLVEREHREAFVKPAPFPYSTVTDLARFLGWST